MPIPNLEVVPKAPEPPLERAVRVSFLDVASSPIARPEPDGWTVLRTNPMPFAMVKFRALKIHLSGATLAPSELFLNVGNLDVLTRNPRDLLMRRDSLGEYVTIDLSPIRIPLGSIVKLGLGTENDWKTERGWRWLPGTLRRALAHFFPVRREAGEVEIQATLVVSVEEDIGKGGTHEGTSNPSMESEDMDDEIPTPGRGPR
jgi:hypothetical protein